MLKKTERLAVKVLPAHKLALLRMAEAEDLSGAAIVRRLIRAEAERRHVWRDAPESRGQARPAGSRMPGKGGAVAATGKV